METRKLIICRGIQGSGKSTFAKAWAKEDPTNRIRVNNDDIRNMLGEYWVPIRENLVSRIYHTTIMKAMGEGYNIIVDNMNLNPKTCNELENIVQTHNLKTSYTYEIEYKNFFIPVEECISRDALRSNSVGEKVIKDTWERYRNFIISENVKDMLAKKAEYVDSGRPAIIVDMDATLCLNISGRPFYGAGAAEGMLNDMPIEEVCDLVRTMSQKLKVIIVTGREGTEEIVNATTQWLHRNGIIVDKMFFRPIKDYSSGSECKKKIYLDNIKGKYNIQFVLEDNYKCVEMFRNLGLTVLQPNNGQI